MKNLLSEIKDRKVRKYLAIYLSASITAIGLVHLFSLRYHLPTYIFDTLLICVFFGIISISLIAWYHGKEGRQKLKVQEYIYQLIIIALTVTTSIIINKSGPVQILSLNSKTIAVLPFTNMSDSKEDEYFSDGITEDILTQLSKISELKVISRTSVLKYKNSELTIPEIAKELGAGSILEGSVRRYGDKVRITSQLINSNLDEHIWAETYDRKLNDIFEVQSEIAKHIARELETQLAPKEVILIDTKPTDNIEAYALCLQGRKYASRYTDEDNEEAIQFYKKALRIDFKYALAYASLASAYDQKVRRYSYPNEWRDSAIIMSNKALSLDPDLAEGHSSLAKSYEAQQDYKMAKYHYEEAIRLNPNYYAAIYNLGVVYFNELKLDKAYKLISDSIIREPDNVFGYIVLGGINQKLNCDNLALKWFKRAFDLDSKNLIVHYYIIDQYIFMKDFMNAEKYLDQLIDFAPEWSYGLTLAAKLEMMKGNYLQSRKFFDKSLKLTAAEKEYDYGFVMLKLNRTNEAQKIFDAEILNYSNNLENSIDGICTLQNGLADIYAIMGNKQKSLNWLKKAVGNGWIEYRQNLEYPYMDSLKGNKEFQSIINLMKAKTDSIKGLALEADPNLESCK